MGSAESSYEERFHQKYNFVQPLQDPNYGPLRVYRKRELNFDYVALIDRPLPASQLAQVKRELELVRGSFAEEVPPMLLRVFHVEEVRSTICSNSGGKCGEQGLRVYL
jgi:hypothetical protein